MNKIPLTVKQNEILLFLKQFKKDNKGIMPTLNILSRAFGIAGPTMYEHLMALERKGWIKKYKFYARAIELL